MSEDIVERLQSWRHDSWPSDPSLDAAAEIERLRARVEVLEAALRDMLSGWRYIRETHGDLYGVGWDRAEEKARAALEAKP
jgi:hypothetical protein